MGWVAFSCLAFSFFYYCWLRNCIATVKDYSILDKKRFTVLYKNQFTTHGDLDMNLNFFITGFTVRWVLPLFMAALVFLSTSPVLGGEDHACDYLGREEVNMVMGVDIGEITSQPANPMGQSICFFDIPSDTAVRFAQLQMVRPGWAKHKNWDVPSLFKNNMSYLDSLQEIPGIGEKAYWGGSGLKLGAGLHVLYKDAYFTVQAATGDPDANLEKARRLAGLIIKKIK